jgi:hypothetical protein
MPAAAAGLHSRAATPHTAAAAAAAAPDNAAAAAGMGQLLPLLQLHLMAG